MSRWLTIIVGAIAVVAVIFGIRSLMTGGDSIVTVAAETIPTLDKPMSATQTARDGMQVVVKRSIAEIRPLYLSLSGRTEAAHELLRRVPDELYSALLGAATGEPVDRARLAPMAASGRWPGPVAAHLLGELDEGGLLDAADDLKYGAGLATQRCEARTYLGLVAERAGDPKAALAHYQAAVETSATQVLELALSRRRLAALKK